MKRPVATVPFEQYIAEPVLHDTDMLTIIDEELHRLIDDGIDISQSIVLQKPGHKDDAVQTKYEQLHHDVFRACLGVAATLPSRIDPTLYAQQNIQKITDWDPDDISTFTGILASVGPGLERARTIKTAAYRTTARIEQDVIGDRGKQYDIAKLLAADHVDQRLTNTQFAAQLFIGIAGGEQGPVQTAIEQLDEGLYDDHIAADLLEAVIDTYTDGEKLTQSELDLCRMIEHVQFYSSDEPDTIIRKFATSEGVEQWPPDSIRLLADYKNALKLKLQAFPTKMQAYMKHNFLHVMPLSEDEFKVQLESIFDQATRLRYLRATVNQKGQLNLAEDRRLERAKVIQAERRERLLARVGMSDRGLLSEMVRGRESASQVRTITEIISNGISAKTTVEGASRVIDSYLSSYGNDGELARDVQAVIQALATSSLDAQTNHGIKKLSGNAFEVIDGKKLPVYRFKPIAANGLSLSSPHSRYMRVFFVMPNKGSIAIAAIERRGRMARLMKNRYGMAGAGGK